MAFAVDVFANTRPIGTSISRFGRSFHFLSGATLIGAGFAASAWIVATVATMHMAAPAPHPSTGRFADIALAPAAIARTEPMQRLVHVKKFSRLRMSSESELAEATGIRVAAPSAALAAAFVGQSEPLAISEGSPNKQPAMVAATTAPALPSRETKDDAVTATPVAVASADRIIIPSKEEIAVAEGPALLALAARPADPIKGQVPPAAAKPGGPVEVASLASAAPTEQPASSTQPFDLVLSGSDTSIPLPMARPDGLTKRATLSDRSAPAEPVLAYARPDAGASDDDEDAMPTVKKGLSAPVARSGVAVYDISANIVYLPNGERLEAHSGLGKMRDNPRYVNAKNRGPTPPHTYNLTMRESLFHGVEAIRLNPVGGAGYVYNRVGLLAHTYMLGARGDSNGCVSFRDYKRFLAAFKRGQIRQLVVVTSMPNKPTSTFASLFSSRS
ncbi:hypothetical protein ATY81_12910 [Rhizobium sp. R72]|uniref:tlde1 domain-containing protein n=1 Tax=unclassified Rhizobium TaxID=2613769 RepID=UPI000B52EABF|nr:MULTISPECIES: DUF2778 domain-containing protein [unclassified Rhizobium]OWV94331.1 hypothetical protein ATY81_12910 [Rhizobium sp. R72]OWV94601.1 hypothetical protein ATY80_12910 [Rhizobium sp. R711]OWV99097.1 hypothetical protein ATY79_18075 [Rhizobium sp. R693]